MEITTSEFILPKCRFTHTCHTFKGSKYLLTTPSNLLFPFQMIGLGMESMVQVTYSPPQLFHQKLILCTYLLKYLPGCIKVTKWLFFRMYVYIRPRMYMNIHPRTFINILNFQYVSTQLPDHLGCIQMYQYVYKRPRTFINVLLCRYILQQ